MRQKKNKLICLGEAVGAHGVKGALKVAAHTQRALDFASYGVLCNEEGEPCFDITSARALSDSAKPNLIITLAQTTTREEAQALRGVKFYLPRARFRPLSQDEFYHADLIGLMVRDKEGASLGEVLAVHNFGAGDIIETREHMLAFNDQQIVEVNIEQGYVVAQIIETETEQPDER